MKGRLVYVCVWAETHSFSDPGSDLDASSARIASNEGGYSDAGHPNNPLYTMVKVSPCMWVSVRAQENTTCCAAQFDSRPRHGVLREDGVYGVCCGGVGGGPGIRPRIRPRCETLTLGPALGLNRGCALQATISP